MNKKLLIVLLTLPFLFDSCSLWHKISRKQPLSSTTIVGDTSIAYKQERKPFMLYPKPDTIALPADTLGYASILLNTVMPLWNNRLAYRTMSTKIKVHFETPEDQKEFTTVVRLKKDSVMWVDISVFGGIVHAARALINKDSIHLINYIEKEVTSLSMKDVAKLLPIDVNLSALQNLVIGDPLVGGNVNGVTALTEGYLLKVMDSAYNQEIIYNKADSTIVSDQILTNNPTGPQAVIKMNDYQIRSNRRLSLFRKINIQNGVQLYYIEMEFQNIDFDEPVDFPFNIPRNYSLK